MARGKVPVVMTKTLKDFSKRERDVIRAVGNGKSYRQIARDLGLRHRYIQQLAWEIAQKIPGTAKPRTKLMLFYHRLD